MKTKEEIKAMAEEWLLKESGWRSNPHKNPYKMHIPAEVIQWDNEQSAFIGGYTAANQWVPVGERLPEERNKWHESDYVLGRESETSYPFTVWYNHDTKIWHLADHRITIQELNIAFWMPIP